MGFQKVYSGAQAYSQGESEVDLEILDTVHFLIFLVQLWPQEAISAECQFFYQVAFLWGRFGVTWPKNGRKKNATG